MRVHGPLAEEHPLVGSRETCMYCSQNFEAGDMVTLVPIETPEQSGSLAVECLPAHESCARAREAVFPDAGPN